MNKFGHELMCKGETVTVRIYGFDIDGNEVTEIVEVPIGEFEKTAPVVATKIAYRMLEEVIPNIKKEPSE